MSRDFSKKPKDQPKHRKNLRTELQYLGQTASTETALFHQKAAEYYGLGITDMKAVSTLMQEGHMTAGQLADRLSLTTGAVTNLIDRLEEHGAVQRLVDPTDRRKVIVAANVKAIADSRNIYESMAETFDKVVRSYSDAELRFLVDYYKKSIELTQKEIARLPKTRRPL